jgi:hypothetical protein
MICLLQKHFHYMLINASDDNILQALDIMIFNHIPQYKHLAHNH